jgi:hypothetical protein
MYHYYDSEIKWASALVTVNTIVGPQLFVVCSWMATSHPTSACFSYLMQTASIPFTVWIARCKVQQVDLANEWAKIKEPLFTQVQLEMPQPLV